MVVVATRQVWLFEIRTQRALFLINTERRREKAAIDFAREMLDVKDDEVSKKVVSSWGP